ncbi:MAG: DciA family protein [Candidatus Contendobacter sp.]|nr:DciA family protein [Candidatus Contendobacter sp.]MDG4558700.1 DciA family protein [Candidatus Contendobacter sp.]
MADADARAAARRHTACLLKMLRGYGPRAESESDPVARLPVAAARPATVAEAVPAYVRLLDAASPPPLPAAQVPPPDAPPPREANPIPTVGEILRRPRGKLGQLMAQADRLIQLSRIFYAYLPPYLRDHAVLIRLDPESWEVRADSAAWATRLRYVLPSIRQALGQQLDMTLPKPRIRVAPVAVPPQSQRRRLTLTRRNAALLEATARGLTDPRLGAALRRLAAHGRPGTKT